MLSTSPKVVPIQLYIYPGVPPITLTLTVPLFPPTQLTSVVSNDNERPVPGWFKSKVSRAEQPCESRIKAIYCPVTRPKIESPFAVKGVPGDVHVIV